MDVPAAELPRDWQLAWPDEGPAAGDAPRVLLRVQADEAAEARGALRFLAEGLAPFGGGALPLGAAVIELSAFPTLDELLVLWLTFRLSRGEWRRLGRRLPCEPGEFLQALEMTDWIKRVSRSERALRCA